MKQTGFILSVAAALSISAFGGAKLDISTYLRAADEGKIYPSAKQMDMLRPLVPETVYRPAPSFEDRTFWNRIAAKESAQQIVEQAQADFEKKPEVPITDEIYRRANKEGNRGIYKPRYYRTMERLERATIAECIENQGRYLPQIEEHIKGILEMKSWLHPNHDPGNSVLEGKRVAIDLGARKFGSVLMLADLLLEDKLPSSLRKEIHEQIRWRMTESYFKSCRGEDKKGNSWIWGTSNWNSVCTGGTLFSTLTSSENLDERVAMIGCALNSMKFYLEGFGADGYCSEGIGYWNYGFGNYLYLSQMVFDYTGGAIDMFTFTDPEKMKRVGNFPAHFEIQNGIYPCFADGGSTFKSDSDNFAYILSAKNYGAAKPTYSRPADITMQLMEWADPVSYVDPQAEKPALPSHTYFEDMGIVISRGRQDVPFSIAIKSGHNAENHNHMDVGSYVMVLDRDHIMCGDLGAPPYQAGSFSPKHKMRSSWGHPVPRVDGTLQSEGKAFRGKVLETEFAENRDRVVLDLSAAYEVQSLEKLVRTMTNDKSGNGTITIKDEFSASKPIAFDTAIMTHTEYKIINDKTILLKNEGKTIRVEVSAEGGDVEILDEEVKVKAIRYADQAFKIWIEFKDKLKAGTITMVFTPE
ncbi:heparinase II/III family protein [Pontiella sp.]|uniref:heparinase II/III domain-containing protein n=1 Tax=Pontiella sp. TaxID=2837462 RepID=UPI0035639F23